MSDRTHKSRRALRILYAGGESPRVHALIDLLRHRSHEVVRIHGIRQILAADHANADVLVLDAGEERGTRDLLLLEEVSRAGIPLPIVLVSRRSSDDLCERAFELDVVAVVQGAYEPRTLSDAVERAVPDRVDGLAQNIETCEYPITESSLEASVSDLAARLDALQVTPSHLARVMCASAELVDNVLRYAYPSPTDSDRFTVETRIQRSHVHVVVRDSGCGFDARRSRLESVPAALPRTPMDRYPVRGLSRAAALAEGFDVLSDTQGSTIRLDFELYPVRSGEREAPAALACLPSELRRLIESLRGDATDAAAIPPALELVLPRLLGHLPARRKAGTRG